MRKYVKMLKVWVWKLQHSYFSTPENPLKENLTLKSATPQLSFRCKKISWSFCDGETIGGKNPLAKHLTEKCQLFKVLSMNLLSSKSPMVKGLSAKNSMWRTPKVKSTMALRPTLQILAGKISHEISFDVDIHPLKYPRKK